MRKTVLALIAATLLLGTSGSTALAKIVLPTLDDIDTRELEPRSGSYDRDRQILLLRKLIGLAMVCRAQGDFEDALAANLAARKIDRRYNQGMYFEYSFQLAHLYGDMNRWRDATREFDRLITNGDISTAAEIVKYALDHKQLRIASSYEKYLEKTTDDPSVLLVLSRLLTAKRDKAKAMEVAKHAYCLSAASGVYEEETKNALASLQNAEPEKLIADKSFGNQFWQKVEALRSRNSCPTSDEARSMVDAPVVDCKKVKANKKIVPLAFCSAAVDGSIKTISLMANNERGPKALSISPNRLRCRLNKSDVLEHLRTKSIANYQEKQSDESELIVIDDVRNMTIYEFSPSDADRLLVLYITYKETGAKETTGKYEKTLESPSWSVLFTQAEEALAKRDLARCQRKLTKGFSVWNAERHAHPGNYAARRVQYDQLKNLFINLYIAWEKPKIADYFRTATLPDIQEENDNVLYGIMPDFPPAKHQFWKVSKATQDCFDVYPGKQGLSVVHKGGKLYDELVRLVGENPENEKVIDAPPTVLIDDECFKENPLFP